MPTAVVVGTGPEGLHLAARLSTAGFSVTLLEPGPGAPGARWLELLGLGVPEERQALEANPHGLFLDFPLDTSLQQPHHDQPLSQQPQPLFNRSSTGSRSWVPDMLAQHLSLYARSTGLDRCIRFGCKLHRAKWQAMNGCWRLEYRNGAQRGQLSADLLVVSKSAVAVPRMPKLQGRELYHGVVLQANEQLSGEGGAAILNAQLAGRHVLVVGCGAAARVWAERCRGHVGAGGSVTLMEVPSGDGEDGAGQGERMSFLQKFTTRADSRRSVASHDLSRAPSTSRPRPRGLLSRLLGSCACLCPSVADREFSSLPASSTLLPSPRPPTEPGTPRGADGASALSTQASSIGALVSPPSIKHTARRSLSSGGGGVQPRGDGAVRSARPSVEGTRGAQSPRPSVDRQPCPLSEDSGALDVDNIEVTANLQGASGVVVGYPDLMSSSPAGEDHDAGGPDGGDLPHITLVSELRFSVGEQAEEASGRHAGEAAGGEQGSQHNHNNTNGVRVIRATTGALLNGQHVTLGTGEEYPAEVVLLVPLPGLEPDLSFLDISPSNGRISMGGNSSIGPAAGGNAHGNNNGSFANSNASFHRARSAVMASAGSAWSVTEGLSQQLRYLYRDIVSCSPAAPNLAMVGATAPGEHDARLAAVTAKWLIGTWVEAGADGGDGLDGGGGFGGEDAGFLRQATPVDAAADAELRAKWQREAARKGGAGGGLYAQRLLQLLLSDLGLVRAPKGLTGLLGGPGGPDRLTPKSVVKLLRLRPVYCDTDEQERGNSAAVSPVGSRSHSHTHGRNRAYPMAGGGGGSHGTLPYHAGAGGLRGAGSMPTIGDRESNASDGRASLTPVFSAPARSSAPAAMRHISLGVHGHVSGRSPHGDGAGSPAYGGPPSSMSPRSFTNRSGTYGDHPSPQLYSVVEHPEYGSGYGEGNGARGGSGGGGRASEDRRGGGAASMLYAMGSTGRLSGEYANSPLGSCPNSPSHILAQGVYQSGGSITSRFRSPPGALFAPGSPGSMSAGPLYDAAGGGGGGGYGSPGPGSPGPGGGAPGPHPWSLTRHRSQSRLAGTSSVSTSPLGPGPLGLPAKSASRRTPLGHATSSSLLLAAAQRSCDGSVTQTPSSPFTAATGGQDHTAPFSFDRQSNSGRVSYTRRTPTSVSMGGSGGAAATGSGRGPAPLRVNSAARLQLLMAAANSASRKRNMLPPGGGSGGGAGPSPSRMSSSGLPPSPRTSDYRGSQQHRMSMGASLVLQNAHSAGLLEMNSDPLDMSVPSSPCSGGGGAGGGGASLPPYGMYGGSSRGVGSPGRSSYMGARDAQVHYQPTHSHESYNADFASVPLGRAVSSLAPCRGVDVSDGEAGPKGPLAAAANAAAAAVVVTMCGMVQGGNGDQEEGAVPMDAMTRCGDYSGDGGDCNGGGGDGDPAAAARGEAAERRRSLTMPDLGLALGGCGEQPEAGRECGGEGGREGVVSGVQQQGACAQGLQGPQPQQQQQQQFRAMHSAAHQAAYQPSVDLPAQGGDNGSGGAGGCHEEFAFTTTWTEERESPALSPGMGSEGARGSTASAGGSGALGAGTSPVPAARPAG